MTGLQKGLNETPSSRNVFIDYKIITIRFAVVSPSC